MLFFLNLNEAHPLWWVFSFYTQAQVSSSRKHTHTHTQILWWVNWYCCHPFSPARFLKRSLILTVCKSNPLSFIHSPSVILVSTIILTPLTKSKLTKTLNILPFFSPHFTKLWRTVMDCTLFSRFSPWLLRCFTSLMHYLPLLLIPFSLPWFHFLLQLQKG